MDSLQHELERRRLAQEMEREAEYAVGWDEENRKQSGEVFALVGKIDEQLNALDERLNCLTKRLFPIIEEDPDPESSSASIQRAARCELGGRLSTIEFRICEQTRMLMSLIEHIQL